MPMSIGAFVRLTELVSPPDYPVRSNGDWKRFVSTNGFWPPEDYRMLVREYGSGLFAGWLYLIEPFDHARTFTELIDAECRRLQQAGYRASAYPEPGGLMPWGKTTTGDTVGWHIAGKPENWSTVFWGSGGQSFGQFDLSTIGFVLNVVEQNLGPLNGSSSPWPTVGTTSFKAATS